MVGIRKVGYNGRIGITFDHVHNVNLADVAIAKLLDIERVAHFQNTALNVLAIGFEKFFNIVAIDR